MLFLWFYHACRRGSPRFLMVADHVNYLTFEDPGAVNTLRRALKLAHARDYYGAAETAGVDVGHASVVSDALRRGMRFSIGAEVDNDPRSRPDAQNIVDAMRPDGLIRAVNFVNVEHPEKGADWAWAFDNPEFAHLHDVVGADKLWELYMAKLLDDLEKLPAHIVGHFYGPAGFGHWPAQKQLEEYEDRLLSVCHTRGLAIEVNTRFLYRDNTAELKKQYLEANARLVRKAKALGVGIAIGSDAHSPKDQGNAFDVVLKMLDEAKINEVVFPVGGRLARVALRATREHLEAQAKTRDTSTPGSSITGFSRAELGLPEQLEMSASARRESARAAREAASKKRSSGSGRSGKRAEKAASKSTSKRSAESSSSSGKAKATRASKPPAATPKKAEPKSQPKPLPPKPAKSPAKSTPKPAAKSIPKAPLKKAAAKAGKAPAKAPKPVPKPAPKAPAKLASARPAPKPAKVTRPAAKKVASAKSGAKKASVTKRAPAAKKPAAKPAPKSKKPTPKKPAKAPPKASATKKKPTTKRR